MRQQIWAALCNIRFKAYYMSMLVSKFQRWDRRINVFLALASSGSIAAWAVWQTTPLIWAGIIALSQIITVVKPYFPFSKYVKELNLKSLKMESLSIEFERLWHNMESEYITEKQASEFYFKNKTEAAAILNFRDDTIFKEDENIKAKANRKMKTYIKTNYGIDINI